MSKGFQSAPFIVLAMVWLEPGVAADSQAELAKQSLNPVAALYSLPIQYNWNQKLGPSGEGYQSVTNIQPVLPFSLNEEWNLISRTILPVIDQHGLVPGGIADKSGVGDTTQSFFFSPKQPTASGWIWGAGPAILAPTGSDDLLSNEQWGLGPTVVALKQSNGWTRGILANHIWSLENSPPDDKDKVNQTFLQPFFSFTTHTYTTFGINTESTYDWQTKEWSVPINLFVTQLFKVGHQPMSLQMGPRYWVDSPENGAEGWGISSRVYAVVSQMSAVLSRRFKWPLWAANYDQLFSKPNVPQHRRVNVTDTGTELNLTCTSYSSWR